MSLICAQQACYSLFRFISIQTLPCSRGVQQTQGRQMSVFRMANCQPGDAVVKGTEGIHFVAEAKEHHSLTQLVYVFASQKLMK